VQLFDHPASGPSWSPASDRIAFYYGPPSQRRLGILPASGGAVTWSIPAAVYVNPTVRWMPDGSGLLVNAEGKGLANNWKQPFRGDPHRLTNFYEEYANTFDLSPDGKWIALSRGQISRDAIMITNFE